MIGTDTELEIVTAKELAVPGSAPAAVLATVIVGATRVTWPLTGMVARDPAKPNTNTFCKVKGDTLPGEAEASVVKVIFITGPEPLGIGELPNPATRKTPGVVMKHEGKNPEAIPVVAHPKLGPEGSITAGS